MTKFYEVDGDYWVLDQSKLNNIVDRLPAGNYVVKQHPMTGQYYFAKYDKTFSPPTKVYGGVTRRASRIIETFFDREGSTGVLLSGEKGSGKTMLAKMVSHLLHLHHHVPTIFVSEPHTSQAFMELIGSLDQPIMVLFDEIEKVYDGQTTDNFGSQDQKALLTLFDGVFTTKCLFVLTCNDKFGIDEHLINRPGRLYYAYEYSGLEENFVREYCADVLQAKDSLEAVERTDEIIRMTGFFGHFNFDMLKALVEEMNRYGESAREALSHLNINPERDYNEYEATLIPLGQNTPLLKIQPTRAKNPLSWTSNLTVYTYELPASYGNRRKGSSPTPTDASLIDDDNDTQYTEFQFTRQDIKLSTSEGFELVNSSGEKLILRKAAPNWDWRAF